MKFVWTFFLLTIVLPVQVANASEQQDLSIIESIDDLALPPGRQHSSEEALPHEDYLDLLEILQTDDFTVLSETRVRNLFFTLARNPRARNRIAGGKCSYRRSYIQGYLRQRDISSGSLYIQCPSRRGRLRMIDQVTGRRYTFSNFHDTNIVAVPSGYKVMDVQFKSGPVSLSQYLADVEASQKLKPLRNRASGDQGYCYWSIR